MAKPYTYRILYLETQSDVHEISGGDLTFTVDNTYPHNFAGIVWYNDSGGATPVTPSGGTATITIKTPIQPQGFQSITGGILAADVVSQVDWAGNTEEIKVAFDSIVGATHARLFWAGNSS